MATKNFSPPKKMDFKAEEKVGKAPETDIQLQLDKMRQELESKFQLELDRIKKENSTITEKVEKMGSQPINQTVVPYPETERKNDIITELELQFRKYGVGKKGLVFIRKQYNGDYMIKPEATLTRNGNVVRLAYARNIESPFVEDHPRDPNWHPESAPIWFQSLGEISRIVVPPSDPCLQRFLIANPKFNRNYYLEDKKQEAAKALDREDKVYAAIKRVDDIFLDDETEARILATYVLNSSEAATASLIELKKAIREYVKETPNALDLFSRDRKFSALQYLYLKSEAIGLIRENKGYLELTWNNFRMGVVSGRADETFANICDKYPQYVSILKEKTGIEI